MNPNELDQDVVTLAKAIRQVESGGKFDARGASGEYGAYQFTEPTWKASAQKYLGAANAPLTPENQNKVAYSQIKEWKDAGMRPDQIASMWNSGKPDPTGNVGVNSKGVKYDTPGYVNKVKTAYAGVKGSNPPPAQGGGSMIPTAYASDGTTPQPKKSFMETAGGVTDAIFGGGKIGEAIGTHIAKGGFGDTIQKLVTGHDLSKEEEATVGAGPSAGQIAGDVGRVAVNFTPVGRLSGGIGARLAAEGVKRSKLAGNVASGALAGYGFDVTEKARQGESDVFTPGTGTLVGGGLPLVAPAVKLAGRGATNVLGATSGAGSQPFREALSATAEGGAKATAFRDAMRGKTTPEAIVQEAKDAFKQVVQKRTDDYQSNLAKVAGQKENYDVSPVVKTLQKKLSDFRVVVGQDGALDFSRSPIRFNKQAQDDIQLIVDTMKGWGTQKGDRTAVGLDSLKRAFDDLYTPSGQARNFVSDMRKSVRKILEDVPGYDEMEKSYANSTKFIKDIDAALSLGDKKSVDTAFRKLTTALRTNNEFRQQVLRELNDIGDGMLIPKIAGQQLSEALPRGLMRVAGGIGGVGGLSLGVGIVPLLQMFAFTSPRLLGEFISALGWTAKQASPLKAFLKGQMSQGASPGDVLINRFKQEAPAGTPPLRPIVSPSG